MAAAACVELSDLKVNHNLLDKHFVIGIDEGQFLPDTVLLAEEMTNLDVIKLTAVCMVCFHAASFTKKYELKKNWSDWWHRQIHGCVSSMLREATDDKLTCKTYLMVQLDSASMALFAHLLYKHQF